MVVTSAHTIREEISQQPHAIQATLDAEREHIADFAEQLRQCDIRRVLLAARGTSENAATFARYLFGVNNHVLVGNASASLFTVYGVEMDLSDTLVLGISQSGRASDVVELLEQTRPHAALTAAVTNTAESPICHVAQIKLLTHADREQSIPATKTYTTALAVLHQLSAYWAQDTKMIDSIQQVPQLMAQVFAQEDHIRQRSERYRYLETASVLARGLDLCTAQETALKFAECSQIVSSAYSAASFMHGPIAALGKDVLSVLIAPQGQALGSMLEVAMALEERNAETLVISNEPSLLEIADVPIEIPPMPEHISPLVTIIAGQLLAYHIALHKRLNPDQPPGRRKVTYTM